MIAVRSNGTITNTAQSPYTTLGTAANTLALFALLVALVILEARRRSAVMDPNPQP